MTTNESGPPAEKARHSINPEDAGRDSDDATDVFRIAAATDLGEQLERRKKAALRLPPLGESDVRDPLLGRPRPRRRRRRWSR
jgi:hypothetical protein